MKKLAIEISYVVNPRTRDESLETFLLENLSVEDSIENYKRINDFLKISNLINQYQYKTKDKYSVQEINELKQILNKFTWFADLSVNCIYFSIDGKNCLNNLPRALNANSVESVKIIYNVDNNSKFTDNFSQLSQEVSDLLKQFENSKDKKLKQQKLRIKKEKQKSKNKKHPLLDLSDKFIKKEISEEEYLLKLRSLIKNES